MKIEVFPALLEDLEQIMDLQVRVFTGEQHIPADMVYSVERAHPQWWCAKEGRRVLGAVAAWQEEGVTHWGRFVTEPALRGRGIGKALARESLTALFAQGVPRVYMEAREATVHIICGMGGRVIGRPEPFFIGTVTPVEITPADFTPERSEQP